MKKILYTMILFAISLSAIASDEKDAEGCLPEGTTECYIKDDGCITARVTVKDYAGYREYQTGEYITNIKIKDCKVIAVFTVGRIKKDKREGMPSKWMDVDQEKVGRCGTVFTKNIESGELEYDIDFVIDRE